MMHPTDTKAPRLLVLSASDVEALLPMADAIDVMDEALRALARNEAYNPLRFTVRSPDGRARCGAEDRSRSWRTSR